MASTRTAGAIMGHVTKELPVPTPPTPRALESHFLGSGRPRGEFSALPSTQGGSVI